MLNFHNRGLRLHRGVLILPYLVFGALVFAFNSTSDLNYFFRGYFVIVEAQIGLVLLYFILAKLKNKRSR